MNDRRTTLILETNAISLPSMTNCVLNHVIFGDTNICDKWESDTRVNQNWLDAKARLESQGEAYVSCPMVLIELLSRLIKPEPEYFSDDLQSFIFQSNNAQNSFLTFPGKFVLRTVLDTDSPISRFQGADFSQWAKLVLSAPSRQSIASAEVELGSSSISYGLDFDVIRDQHKEGRIKFAEQMAQWRASGAIPARQEVARGFLRSQGIIPGDGDTEAIADALDAAYHYQIGLAGQDDSYDYTAQKHRGDWVDSQLLYYLADPSLHILTNDRGLKNRCARSKQAERIIIL